MSDAASNGDFVSRKAVVTGGSRGIGRAVCLELAQRGADVAFIYRSRDPEAEATAAQIRALGRRALALKTDLADASGVAAAIDRAAAEFGRLDILVQAAGAMVSWHETAELSTEAWDRYLAVDLSGAFYAIRATLPHLRQAGGGAIVAISSIAAQMCQARNVQGAAAKAGLDNLSDTLAAEWAQFHIRVNVVISGLVDTTNARTSTFATPEREAMLVKQMPLGRIGLPRDIAAAVLYLVSPAGEWVTGIKLPINGGAGRLRPFG